MQLSTDYRGRDDPFEGDRIVAFRGLPAGATVQHAVLTLTPAAAAPPPPRTPFEEHFVFGTARAGELAAADWGVGASTSDSTLEVDLHARRTLAAATGARVQGATLTVDVGGLFVELNQLGAVRTPDDTQGFVVQPSGALPSVTVSKFRLTPPTGGQTPAVDTVTVRSAPANVTVRLGNGGPFFVRVGELAATETTLDFAEALQTFLLDAKVENGVYVIPFGVHADGIARLDLSLELEYLQGQSLLPEGLGEVVLPFDLSTFARSGSGSLSVRLPAGAQVVPGRTTARLRGAFDSTRIAGDVGTGDAAATAEVVVQAARAAAQPVEAAGDVVATGFDLFLAPLTPTVRLSLTLLGDGDGKPFGDPLLPAPLEVTLSREESRAAAWVTVQLDQPFNVERKRRYWAVLQALAGEASWPAAAAAAGAVPLQASTDGGLSWTNATDAHTLGPLAALHRLRVTPPAFRMPISLEVGAGDATQRVSLRRFEPLGRVDLTLDTPELAHAFDAAVTRAAPEACPTGEHVLNGEFDDWIGVGDVLSAAGSIDVEGSPRAIAFSADGRRAYVGSFAAGTSEVSNTRTLLEPVELAPGAADAPIVIADGAKTLTAEPLGVLLDPGGERAYVFGDMDGEGWLAVADLAAGAAVGEPIVVDPFAGAVMAPDGRRILFLRDGANAAEIAAADTREIERLAGEGQGLPQKLDLIEVPLPIGQVVAGSLPLPFATASLGGDTLLVFAVADETGAGAASLCLVTEERPTAPTFVPIGQGPVAIAATADGHVIAVACTDKTLRVVTGDAPSDPVVSITLAATPVAVTLSEDGGRAAVLSAATVVVYDLATRRQVASVDVAADPVAVAGSPRLDVILVAESEAEVARFATPAVPLEWTLTSGGVQPLSVAGDLAALLGRRLRPDVVIGPAPTPPPRGPSAISQVVPVSGGCGYAFSFRALADQPDSVAEVLWRGADCGLARADRIPIAELQQPDPKAHVAAPEPALVIHRKRLQAPAGAGQAEIRFAAPSGGLAAVAFVSLRGSDTLGANEDLQEVTDGRPASWSADPATAELTLDPGGGSLRVANDGTESGALVQALDVASGRPLEIELVERTIVAGAEPGPQLEVRLLDANGKSVGDPAVVPLPRDSFDRVALAPSVPDGVARAELRLVLPTGGEVALERVAVRQPTDVEVPVVFRAEAPGELAVAAAEVNYDIVEAPVPKVPETGLCSTTAPEDEPGAEPKAACCCCGSHDTVEGDAAAITPGGRAATVRRCANCGCRTVAVAGRPQPNARRLQPSRVLRHAFGTGPGVLRDEEVARRHALTEVPGIGRARARKLARLGIVTAERLAKADPAVIAKILGHVSVRTARMLVERAASVVTNGAVRR